MAQPLRQNLLISILVTLLCSCSTVSKYNWVPSPNFNERRPNFVIIHQTDSINHDKALNTLTDPTKEVSAHYLIAKDGRITQMVEEKDRAWHAGKSWWGGQTDMNSVSIGIELDHSGDLPFEATQINALLVLLKEIGGRHQIPPANYLAHGDVAPGRKVDPNSHFPWKMLAGHGFGIWCSDEESAQSSKVIDPLLGLQALGYDVSNPENTALAFRRHFRGDNSSSQLVDADLRVLTCLLKKKMLVNAGTGDVKNGAPGSAVPSTNNGASK
jgi:N-acetylmuramoyl-L-alanine amidase